MVILYNVLTVYPDGSILSIFYFVWKNTPPQVRVLGMCLISVQIVSEIRVPKSTVDPSLKQNFEVLEDIQSGQHKLCTSRDRGS